MMTFERVKKIALMMSDVAESTSYGTPALKVRSKLMARLKEDSETLVLRASWEERERVLTLYPEAYFMSEHYRGHPWVLLRLSKATPAQVKASVTHAWYQSAPKALIARFEAKP